MIFLIRRRTKNQIWKHHKARGRQGREEGSLSRGKPPVVYCTNVTVDNKAKHKTHNVTSVKPEEYTMVSEMNGIQSFIRRSAFHAQVCSINMSAYYMCYQHSKEPTQRCLIGKIHCALMICRSKPLCNRPTFVVLFA